MFLEHYFPPPILYPNFKLGVQIITTVCFIYMHHSGTYPLMPQATMFVLFIV
jgi:hypothetical protein